MQTEFLTEWEILAVLESIKKNETLDLASKAALVAKLETATHLRITFK